MTIPNMWEKQKCSKPPTRSSPPFETSVFGFHLDLGGSHRKIVRTYQKTHPARDLPGPCWRRKCFGISMDVLNCKRRCKADFAWIYPVGRGTCDCAVPVLSVHLFFCMLRMFQTIYPKNKSCSGKDMDQHSNIPQKKCVSS